MSERASPAYVELQRRCARIDRRHTRYRFDAEADLPWSELERPGLHAGPALLRALGVPAAADPERLQWALGLGICQAFQELEELIVRFAAAEAEALGPSRSLELLCEEERKHIAVFARYADALRARRPEWVPGFAACFDASAGLLQHLHQREDYPSAAAYHYLFWINTVFFEEFTVWLDDRLQEDGELIQPVWSRLHAVHRQEEVQHLVTDAAHLEALNLSPAERLHLSKVFLLRLEEGFDRFFGVEAALAFAGEALAERDLRSLPLFADVLGAPVFRRTRAAAPCLQRLAPALAGGEQEPALLGGSPPSAAPAADLAGLLREAAAAELGLSCVDAAGQLRAGTCAGLWSRALRGAAALERAGARPGEQVLLLVPDPAEFVDAFWSCQLAGRVPAPLGLGLRGRLEQDLPRLEAVWARLDDPLVLVGSGVEAAALPEDWRRLPVSALRGGDPLDQARPAAETALIQFSSGSTGTPRGVVLSQANLLANLCAARDALVVSAEDVVISWLPLHHDMGLAYHLTPLLCGAPQLLLDPRAFARRPLRWLELASEHGATVSAAPNFGLAQVLRRLKPDQAARLDLRPLRCVLTGAEPISAQVVERFESALAPAGLRPGVVRPAYGLAEATCAVTILPPGAARRVEHLARESLDAPGGVRPLPSGDPGAASFLRLGPPVPGVQVRVRGSSGRLAPEGVVGEVEVRGPNVCRGYLDDLASSAELQLGEGWIRTGDLGLVREGELVVTGRRKDVLFLNGRNVYAPDLEQVVAQVPGVSPERLAVVGLTCPDRGVELVVPVIRLQTGHGRARQEVVRQVAARLGAAIDYRVEQVVVLPAEFFPRTTSGKVQRHALREALQRGELRAYTVRTRPPAENRGLVSGEWSALAREPGRAGAPAQPPAPAPPPRENPWLERVRAVWAEALELPPEEVDPEASFFELGGDSLLAVEVHTRLEAELGRPLPLELLRDCRTVAATARRLSQELGRPSAPVPAEPRGAEQAGVAVVAMAARLPQAEDLDAFWRLLREGRCACGPVPAERWDAARYHDPDPRAPGKTVCTQGAFLDDVRGFEPEAFGLDASEAREMDPQQRLFLELAAEALAGFVERTRRVGVFAGGGQNQYFQRNASDVYRITGRSAQANLDHMLAARIAHQLRLTGPALTLDAACATSLVAVHQACRSLQAGECELALAGGVELNLTVLPFLLFSQAGVLSPSGRCRPFARQADGFVPGEGAGVVLLKPLAAALRDEDPLLGVIRGSAVNNDGGSLSGLAPNPAGQREVLRQAYRAAGVEPGTIGYLEAHGTGTPIGDPIEVRALAQVFGESEPGTIPLGSVKSNLGHLLHAAGVVSLIKVLLSLREQALPPTLGCEDPDPRIRFEETPFAPLQTLTPWPRRPDRVRRAGVSAFGIGGTNCHLVVEEGPAPAAPLRARDAHLLGLSAHDAPALRRVAAGLARALRDDPGLDLARVCASANRSAARFPLRRALVVRDGGQAQQALAAVSPGARAGAGARLVFLLPGPGSQCLGMGRHLLRGEPVFREAIQACDALTRPLLGRSLLALLEEEPSAAAPAMDAIDHAQPVVFAFSYALGRWLEWLGVRPDAVIGHSAGEYAGAVLAGVLTLEEAATLVTRRGQHMSRSAPGAMAAVFADEVRLRPLLEQRPGVGIAALNEPGQVVVSGQVAAVEALLAELAAEGVESRRLAISCAAHSALMQPAGEAFAEDLARVSPRAPRLPFFSSLVGARVAALGADYWRDHLLAPVRFASAVRAALQAGYRHFVELGASAALSGCVARIVETHRPDLREQVSLAPLARRAVRGWAPTQEALGSLLEAGVPLDLARLDGAARCEPVRLPPYPYARRPLWLEPPPLGVPAAQAPAGDARLRFSLEGNPSIRDHRVHGTPCAPAALLFDRVLAALSRTHVGCALEEVVIGRLLVVEPGAARVGRVRELEREGAPALVLETCPQDEEGEGGWREHLAARYRPLRRARDARAPRVDPGALRARCREEVPVEALYQRLAAGGLTYGPSVRTVRALWRGEGELVARLEPDPEQGRAGAPYRLHPGLVDGAMQALAGLTLGVALEGQATFLGFAVRRLRVQEPLLGGCFVHARLLSELGPGAEAIRADVTLFREDGQVLAAFEEVSLKRFHPRERAGLLELPARVYEVGEQALPALGSSRLSAGARVVVLGAPGPLRAAVCREVEARGAVSLAQSLAQVEAGLRPLEGGGERHLLLLEPELAELGEVARLLDAAGVEGIRLSVVSADGALPGFLRALDAERPDWGCQALVAEPGELAPDELARALVQELGSPRERLTVSLREGGRSAPALVPLEGEAAQDLLPPRAVVWITGGLGGLGLAVGEALAGSLGARLLLSGRRTVPDPAALARLEQAGAEVRYAPADVRDRAACRRALDLARSAWGGVQAVIHAAGVLADAPVAARTPERTREVLETKLRGARVLAEVSEGEELALFCLFSSLAGLYGVAGQCDYAAANAGLDVFAQGLRRGGTRVLSLAWGPWRDVGMVRAEPYQAAFRAQGLRPFSPLAGGQAFLRALALAAETDARRLVVVGLDPSREPLLRQALGRPAAGGAEDTAPVRGTGGGDLRGFLLERLARGLHTRPDQLDPAATFHELGVDSLMAVGLVRELERRYGLRLYPTLLFEHPTLEDLLGHLEREHGAAVRAPAPAAAPSAGPAPEAGDCAAWRVEPGAGGLVACQIALPEPGPGSVEVEVRAAGVNFIDLLAVAGMHPTLREERFVPGHEVAGVIRRVGAGVEGLQVGQAVMALLPSGGYAARALAPAAACLPLPPGLGFHEGAAILVTGLTAIGCIETRGRLAWGERVLIQAAAGATGLACVQLALHHGGVVLGTASAPAKLARLRELGVAHAIDYRAEPFDVAVRRHTDGEGVDLVVDSLSGDAIPRGLALLRPGGRFVEIGAAGVVQAPEVDPQALFLAGQDFVTVNVAMLQRTPARLAAALERLGALVREGVLSPQVGHVVAFADAERAHRLLRERENLGKVVLEL